MHIEDWPIDRVRPYPNNPRVLRNAAEKVAESISAFGWRQPIVVDDEGVVIIGHGRLAAARLLKLATVPVHVAAGLPADKVRALRIADNKTGEFSAWDDAKLADELAAIMDGTGDIVVTGFSRAEFDAIEMQARAALYRIMPRPVAPAPVAATAEQLPYDTEDDDQAAEVANTSTSAPAPLDLVPFNALMKPDDRAVLFEAIAAAKADHDLQHTADALAAIARAYLDA